MLYFVCHHIIELIWQISIVNNISTKIFVDYFISSIGKVDIIWWNNANYDERMTEWSIGKVGAHFFSFFYKAYWIKKSFWIFLVMNDRLWWQNLYYSCLYCLQIFIIWMILWGELRLFKSNNLWVDFLLNFCPNYFLNRFLDLSFFFFIYLDDWYPSLIYKKHLFFFFLSHVSGWVWVEWELSKRLSYW